MAKKQQIAETQATEAQVAATEPTTEAVEASPYGLVMAEQMAPPAPKSVVKTKFKRAYQDRAKAAGLKDKASRRGNGDWLQRELQAETIDKKGNFDIERFVAILDANGVEWDRWNRTSKGWEGRFRMSGSIVLRGIVGKTGLLRTPDGATNVQALADEGDEAAQAFLAKWNN